MLSEGCSRVAVLPPRWVSMRRELPPCFADGMHDPAVGRGGLMHVTEYYDLDRTQAEVDFVDVDVATDNRIFIDPRAIRLQHGDLQESCAACLVSFFTEVLDAIRLNNPSKVRQLMRYLGEPNETHLGFSRGRSRGRGLRGSKTDDIADAISESKAAKTGLLRDLEDTSFLVPGVNKDLLSDMTTQVIRGPLIEYRVLFKSL